MDGELICAVATPEGRGAISLLRLSGKGALEAADRVFFAKNGRPASEREPGKLYFGELRRGGTLVDEGMCAVFRAPRSYTGEDSAEITCHGGAAVTREVLFALFEAGARLAKGGEFTERAFLAGKMSLSAAEAVEEIIDAGSPIAVSHAAEALSGRFGREIGAIRNKLLDAAAHYAAMLDYADEGVEPPDPGEIDGLLSSAREELCLLLRGTVAGRVIREGVGICLIGRTNAGKSTLLNALLGYERAIVTPVAGTTRDVIEEGLTLGSVKFRFLDTAGFRDTADPVERIGIEKSREGLSRAEGVILLFDGSLPPDREDELAFREVEKEKKRRPELRVFKAVNKTDRGIAAAYAAAYKAYFPEEETFFLSAIDGTGLPELTEALEKLGKERGSDPAAVTNLRHADAILRASAALEETLRDKARGITDDVIWSGLASAVSILGEITGDEVREDMIERIFRNFCVGK